VHIVLPRNSAVLRSLAVVVGGLFALALLVSGYTGELSGGRVVLQTMPVPKLPQLTCNGPLPMVHREKYATLEQSTD